MAQPADDLACAAPSRHDVLPRASGGTNNKPLEGMDDASLTGNLQSGQPLQRPSTERIAVPGHFPTDHDDLIALIQPEIQRHPDDDAVSQGYSVGTSSSTWDVDTIVEHEEYYRLLDIRSPHEPTTTTRLAPPPTAVQQHRLAAKAPLMQSSRQGAGQPSSMTTSRSRSPVRSPPPVQLQQLLPGSSTTLPMTRLADPPTTSSATTIRLPHATGGAGGDAGARTVSPTVPMEVDSSPYGEATPPLVAPHGQEAEAPAPAHLSQDVGGPAGEHPERARSRTPAPRVWKRPLKAAPSHPYVLDGQQLTTGCATTTT